MITHIANGGTESGACSNGTELSALFREGSRDVHREAEQAEFTKALLSGTLTERSYLLFLHALHAVYSTLERLLDQYAPVEPALAHVHFPSELRRSTAIRRDIAYYSQRAGTDVRSPPTSGEDYAHYLKNLGARDPSLLLAHAYTRYMGDLSGGQILARKLQRSFALPPTGTAGREYYHFADIPDIASFKDRFRKGVDLAGNGLSDTRQEELVAEVCCAFQLHIDIANEVAHLGNDSIDFADEVTRIGKGSAAVRTRA